MIEPAKLVRLYEGGILTRLGLILRLLQIASERPPGEIAAVLSVQPVGRVA